MSNKIKDKRTWCPYHQCYKSILSTKKCYLAWDCMLVCFFTQERDKQMKGYFKMNFNKELESLINRWSVENDSNTPDFILAQYIISCLAAFNIATQQRETWYGRDARPSFVSDNNQLHPTQKAGG